MSVNKWRVTANYIGGKQMYSVVRLKKPAEPEHGGNREFGMNGYTEDRSEAEKICKQLNEELFNG